jgi:predicted alpha/beta superfamily hydrolase
MHDGQNLFDASTSFSGEWEVDETLNNLFASGDEGVIIVGLENGGATRTEEYTPWSNEKYGGGRGGDYINFLVTKVKPYIDSNYRTKSDRNHTGIMGSSLGGLISLYAAIKYQDVFGKAGVFSPSLWFSEDIYSHVENIGKKNDMKIYLLGGELESETLIKEMDKMVGILHKIGFKDTEIKMISRADGDHNEAFWAREFSDCYSWLFR